MNWDCFPGVTVEYMEHITDPQHKVNVVLTAGPGGVNAFDLATGALLQMYAPAVRHSVVYSPELERVLITTPSDLYIHRVSDLYGKPEVVPKQPPLPDRSVESLPPDILHPLPPATEPSQRSRPAIHPPPPLHAALGH